jgi:prepilin-type N-terminal cleavage/methylation domain-containing protein
MKRRFTLIEILVVLAIMALVMGTVLPRLLRIPKRVQIDGARTSILGALRECAVRAVASGQTVRAKLDADGHTFQVLSVAPAKDALSESKLPDATEDEDTSANGTIVPSKTTYKIPKGVTWELDDWDLEDEESRVPEFTFYADGEASGPDLVFVIVKRRFLLHIDRLTGRADIDEQVD